MVLDTKQKIVVHYIADGEVKEFNFNFQIFEAGDIDVYLDETLTDTGYNVSVDENCGGKVIFSQPPANGTRITIIRNLDIKRTSDFQEGGAFRAKVINHELDYQVATLQQLDEKINRSMVYPPYAQDGISTSLPLPSAGKALVWNQQATALINSSINVDNVISETFSARDVAKNCALAAEDSANSAQISAQKAKTSEANAAQSAEEAKQYLKKSAYGNIGDIKYTTRTDIPNGGVWCDGTEYAQNIYPDVYQMLVDGKIQSTTYATFNSTVSSKGSCGSFALDTANKKFKVPLLKDVYLKAGQTPLMFGAESLPNVAGTFSNNGNSRDGGQASGAFYVKTQTGLTSNGDVGSVGGVIEFDASRSSSAYQDGAKVNPDHVIYRAYVVLYSAVADFSIADYTDVLEEKTNEGIKALSNASSVLAQSQITNCITKIPQNIKLELNNGTLTLKAGSMVYVPNGGGIFDEIITKTDITREISDNGTYFISLTTDTVPVLAYGLISNCFSGDTAPSSTYSLWYNTSSNIIQNPSGNRRSFPIAIVTVSNSSISSIDQVFNGFGFIGNNIFALPGIEYLVAKNINSDGSYNNYKVTLPTVRTVRAPRGTYQYITLNFAGSIVGLQYNKVESITKPAVSTNTLWYNPATNSISLILSNGTVTSPYQEWAYGTVTLDSTGRVISLKPYTTFQVADKNDTEWVSAQGKPSDRYTNLSLEASGISYAAPANGRFFYEASISGDSYIFMYNKKSSLSAQSISGLNSYKALRVSLPVGKGEEVEIHYNLQGQSAQKFRFIYDEGAK